MVAGIFVGLVSGLRKGGIFDATGLGVSLVLISLPIFVIGFVAQYFLGIQLGWFSPTVGAGAPLEDLILPALVLASISFAQIVRLTRSSVIENVSARLRAHGIQQGPHATTHRPACTSCATR